jgi:hypothetical protein
MPRPSSPPRCPPIWAQEAAQPRPPSRIPRAQRAAVTPAAASSPAGPTCHPLYLPQISLSSPAQPTRSPARSPNRRRSLPAVSPASLPSPLPSPLPPPFPAHAGALPAPWPRPPSSSPAPSARSRARRPRPRRPRPVRPGGAQHDPAPSPCPRWRGSSARARHDGARPGHGGPAPALPRSPSAPPSLLVPVRPPAPVWWPAMASARRARAAAPRHGSGVPSPRPGVLASARFGEPPGAAPCARARPPAPSPCPGRGGPAPPVMMAWPWRALHVCPPGVARRPRPWPSVWPPPYARTRCGSLRGPVPARGPRDPPASTCPARVVLPRPGLEARPSVPMARDLELGQRAAPTCARLVRGR